MKIKTLALPEAARRKPGKVMWTLIALTALLTLGIVVVYANLSSSAPSTDRLPVFDFGVRDPQFARELTAVFGKPIVAGNRIETLNNGDEIFPAMLEAIRGAQKSITLEIYVFWKGGVCNEFAQALAEKARSGVEVLVILDWFGALQMEAELVDLLKESGAQVEHYRPLSWYQIDRFNNRTHRRILVVDGRIGFTGGVGISDKWAGDARTSDEFRDMHYRVEGPVVAQLQGAFAENWHKVRGEVLTGEQYFPPLEPAGGLLAQVIASAPGAGNERARDLYLRAVAGATQSIRIGTPYFVPDALVFEALLAAAERGVEISILVPGRSTDSDAARYASRRKWGELIEAGAVIYEYHPEVFYHSKLMIVDDHLSLVGSTNFDSRSFRLNDEINLVVLDESFAKTQVQHFQADIAPADKVDLVTWKNRPLRHKLLEPVALLVQGQL